MKTQIEGKQGQKDEYRYTAQDAAVFAIEFAKLVGVSLCRAEDAIIHVNNLSFTSKGEEKNDMKRYASAVPKDVQAEIETLSQTTLERKLDYSCRRGLVDRLQGMFAHLAFSGFVVMSEKYEPRIVANHSDYFGAVLIAAPPFFKEKKLTFEYDKHLHIRRQIKRGSSGCTATAEYHGHFLNLRVNDVWFIEFRALENTLTVGMKNFLCNGAVFDYVPYKDGSWWYKANEKINPISVLK